MDIRPEDCTVGIVRVLRIAELLLIISVGLFSVSLFHNLRNKMEISHVYYLL